MSEDEILEAAKQISLRKIHRLSTAITSSREFVEFFQTMLSAEEREHFTAVWLDNYHRPISYEALFMGTIDGSQVFPREVIKAAFKVNAAAVIFAHNHPSGNTEASSADVCLTKKLKEILSVVDIRVLDHIIVSADSYFSFAERGLI